jgi:hypothetical protein
MGEFHSRSALLKLPDYTVSNKVYHSLIYLSAVSTLETRLVGWLADRFIAQSKNI